MEPKLIDRELIDREFVYKDRKFIDANELGLYQQLGEECDVDIGVIAKESEEYYDKEDRRLTVPPGKIYIEIRKRTGNMRDFMERLRESRERSGRK